MALFNVLIALSACLAIAFGLAAEPFMFGVFKTLTTSLLIFALLVHRKIFLKSTHRLFLFALIACLAGDIFLLNSAYFIVGLSAFLFGHLLFMRLFVVLGGWSWSAIPLVVLVLIAGLFFYYIEPKLGGFKLPVAVYSSVIVLMSWQGINLAGKSDAPRSNLIAVGVLLFVFSDSMIALNKFVQPFELSVLVILSTYWLSLTLILNAVISIVRYEKALN